MLLCFSFFFFFFFFPANTQKVGMELRVPGGVCVERAGGNLCHTVVRDFESLPTITDVYGVRNLADYNGDIVYTANASGLFNLYAGMRIRVPVLPCAPSATNLCYLSPGSDVCVVQSSKKRKKEKRKQ